MIELALAITGPVCLTLLTVHVLSLRSRERLAASAAKSKAERGFRMGLEAGREEVGSKLDDLRTELQRVVDIHNAAVERMVEVEQQVQRLELAKAGQ